MTGPSADAESGAPGRPARRLLGSAVLTRSVRCCDKSLRQQQMPQPGPRAEEAACPAAARGGRTRPRRARWPGPPMSAHSLTPVQRGARLRSPLWGNPRASVTTRAACGSGTEGGSGARPRPSWGSPLPILKRPRKARSSRAFTPAHGTAGWPTQGCPSAIAAAGGPPSRGREPIWRDLSPARPRGSKLALRRRA